MYIGTHALWGDEKMTIPAQWEFFRIILENHSDGKWFNLEQAERKFAKTKQLSPKDKREQTNGGAQLYKSRTKSAVSKLCGAGYLEKTNTRPAQYRITQTGLDVLDKKSIEEFLKKLGFQNVEKYQKQYEENLRAEKELLKQQQENNLVNNFDEQNALTSDEAGESPTTTSGVIREPEASPSALPKQEVSWTPPIQQAAFDTQTQIPPPLKNVLSRMADWAKQLLNASSTTKKILIIVAICLLLLCCCYSCTVLLFDNNSGKNEEVQVTVPGVDGKEIIDMTRLKPGDTARLGELAVTLASVDTTKEGVILEFLGFLQNTKEDKEETFIAYDDIKGLNAQGALVKFTFTANETPSFKEKNETKHFSLSFEGYEIEQVSITHDGLTATWFFNDDTGLQARRIESAENHELEVVFLDVGQADAALISQNGHYMLIDGGNKGDSSLIYSILQSRGIAKLDYIINSHPDEDHVGGLPGAIQVAEVGQVFSSVTEHDTEAFNDFKNKLSEKGIQITVPQTGDTLKFADSTLEFIQPEKNYGDVNDDSLVVMLTYKGTKFLFTGDIGEATEKDLCDSGIDLKADVLKVPHHGSKYSSTYQFLTEVNPACVVISVGAENTCGHPTEEALSKYRDQGAKLYRTDLNGDVTALSDGIKVSVKLQKTTTKDVYTPNSEYEEKAPATLVPEVAPEPEPPVEEVAPEPSTSYDSETVYITNTGSKYHRDGCRHLSKSKIPTTRGAAIAQGYGPCGTCNPG
jgi:competence protein ComEC